MELDGLGPYCSVNLVPNVSALRSPEEARELAAGLAVSFREAVAKAREELTVPNPSRRRLRQSLGGRPAAEPPAGAGEPRGPVLNDPGG